MHFAQLLISFVERGSRESTLRRLIEDGLGNLERFKTLDRSRWGDGD
jgi:hypothetical protein